MNFYGNSANFVVNFTSVPDTPLVFAITLPLFAVKQGLLGFYLEESWHRYLALHMPLCVVSIGGVCSKKEENTGMRAAACCQFYNLVSFAGESSKKVELARDYARESIELLRRSGMLGKMKNWSQKERLLRRHAPPARRRS